MPRIVLVLSFVVVAFFLSSCQTVKGTVDGAVTGMEKDAGILGAVMCKTGQTVVDAFAVGDSQKSRGAVLKADDWMQQNLW